MKFTTAALAATTSLCFAVSATAAPNLVQNGGFESTTSGPGQLGYNTNATGWTAPAGGYTFLYASGTGDTTGSSGQYGVVSLWGPNNGSANGLPAASPDGGNFVALDGDFQDQPLQQSISGLTIGQAYNVAFYYAFSQQEGFTGATTQDLSVNLGGAYSAGGFTGGTTLTTAPYNLPSHGFSGWRHGDLVFTANNTSELLSFLAYGNQPVPPFALLDGVSLSAVPEPADWALLLLGVTGVGAIARMRRRRPGQPAVI